MNSITTTCANLEFVIDPKSRPFFVHRQEIADTFSGLWLTTQTLDEQRQLIVLGRHFGLELNEVKR
jgi:hypothetical protein